MANLHRSTLITENWSQLLYDIIAIGARICQTNSATVATIYQMSHRLHV